jgi:hypothetical protein
LFCAEGRLIEGSVERQIEKILVDLSNNKKVREKTQTETDSKESKTYNEIRNRAVSIHSHSQTPGFTKQSLYVRNGHLAVFFLFLHVKLLDKSQRQLAHRRGCEDLDLQKISLVFPSNRKLKQEERSGEQKKQKRRRRTCLNTSWTNKN